MCKGPVRIHGRCNNLPFTVAVSDQRRLCVLGSSQNHRRFARDIREVSVYIYSGRTARLARKHLVPVIYVCAVCKAGLVFRPAVAGQRLAIRCGQDVELVAVLLGKDDEGAALFDVFIEHSLE